MFNPESGVAEPRAKINVSKLILQSLLAAADALHLSLSLCVSLSHIERFSTQTPSYGTRVSME